MGHPEGNQVVTPSAAAVLHVFVLFCFLYLGLCTLTCNLVAVMQLKVWPMLFSSAVSKDHQTSLLTAGQATDTHLHWPSSEAEQL